MSNPLHKNKVIQFIKRYPNSEDFSLTTGNQPLTESSNNTFKPGCSVGLSGKAGNPDNFNDLIDMWVAGGLVRNNINPYGLMRLWAATYRTYYDWCRTVKRPYFNPVGSTISTQQRLLSLDEYEIKYTANLNSGSINGKTITGAFVKARRPSISATTLKYDDTTKNDEYQLSPYIPSSLYSTYEETISGSSLPTYRVDFPVGTIATLYGGPVKCELLFNTSVDVDSILIGHHVGGSSYTASPSAPEGNNPFNWFFPSNFKLRVSYDGVNYNGDFNYNNIINNLDQLVFTNKSGTTPINPYDWRQISSLAILYTYPDLITTLNNTSNYSSSVNSTNNLNTYFPNDPNPTSPTSLNQTTYGFPNDTPFTTRIKSITLSTPGYDLSQFSIGRPLKGHEVEVVTITQGSTPKTCIVRTWFRQNSVPRKLSSGSSNVQFIPAEYETNALFALNYGYFEVIDLSSGRICTGTCDPPFSFKGVRALELTSGINDNLLIRPYLAGMIRVRGSIKSFTTTFNTGTTSNSSYIPNYLDSYWTNNSPETFTLGNIQFSDEIANKAFLTVNYTGNSVDKWKRLPYTLPNTGIFLDNEVRLSSITIKNVPIDFDYTEDYINNKIIPLPTDQELIDFEAEALGLGRDPVLHYFRTKISAFLLELINYCKSTCLKFWQYGASTRSVSFYKTYTSQVLQFDNLGLPLDSLISSTIKVYEIPTGGDFDIELSDPAKRMWFLSGGEATRVDVDIAVLQKLLDISGITV